MMPAPDARASLTPTLAPIFRAAERLLSERFGGSVRLGDCEDLSHNDRATVLRCSVLQATTDVPASIILKCVRDEENRAYAPADGYQGSPAWRFSHEGASGALLSALPGEARHGPQLYGSDRAHGLLLLEDWGVGESLADVLAGDDSVRAEAALLAFTQALGRRHAATVGREQEFMRRAEALGANGGTRAAERWLGRLSLPEHLQRFQEGGAAVGVPLASGAEKEMQGVLAAMEEPGPFLAFVNGDVSSVNNLLLAGDGLRFFDFEFGGFRHGLLEGAFARMSFPTGPSVCRLPAALVPRLEAAYRAALLPGCPQAGDDAGFRRAMVQACAYWMVWTASWFLVEALQADRRYGEATIRQRLLLRLEEFAATAEELGHLEALGATARRIAAHLRTLWPAGAVPRSYYAAFCHAA